MEENLSLIDSDILISILRQENNSYKNSVSYISKYERFKISCITYYECLRGYKSLGATKKLNLFNEMMSITDILYIDDKIIKKASEIYALFKPKGLLKGEFDLLIGTTAIVNNLNLVTNNISHYKPLADYYNLKIDTWI